MNDIHMPEQMVQTHRLANGLQIVGQPMPDAESVALAYYVPTGSRDEHDSSMEGISHFLEHMLFKGTATLDRHQLDQECTRIGARRNGYTSIEMTLYYIQVLPEHLERGMELLSAMMYPRLVEQEFTDEKAVILNEIARAEDQPKSVALRHLLRTYFGDQPLGNNVLGTRESIRDMQLDQMRSYWQDRYVAQQMVLSLAGKFHWENFLQLAERHAGRWQRGLAGTGTRVVSAYEPASPRRHTVVEPHLQQQIVLLASHTDTFPTNGGALSILCAKRRDADCIPPDWNENSGLCRDGSLLLMGGIHGTPTGTTYCPSYSGKTFVCIQSASIEIASGLCLTDPFLREFHRKSPMGGFCLCDLKNIAPSQRTTPCHSHH